MVRQPLPATKFITSYRCILFYFNEVSYDIPVCTPHYLKFFDGDPAVSDNLLLTTADYFGKSDENGPQAIAVRTLEAIKEHLHDAQQPLPIDFRGRGEARATGNQGRT